MKAGKLRLKNDEIAIRKLLRSDMRIITISIILITIIIGCRSTQEAADMNNWENPVIHIRNHPGIERIFRQEGEGLQENNEAGLKDFLDRTNSKFRESEISIEEANNVYEMLHESGMLFNEPTGMPDPDEPRSRETVDDLKKRIAIRKKDENTYYIFFVRTSCGFTYFYGCFSMPDEADNLNLQPIESWRASVPC